MQFLFHKVDQLFLCCRTFDDIKIVSLYGENRYIFIVAEPCMI